MKNLPKDPDGFSNQVQGPKGWTESMDLDTIGLLVRLGLVTHTYTMVRKVRVRRFEAGADLPYKVNAPDDVDPRLVEQVQG